MPVLPHRRGQRHPGPVGQVRRRGSIEQVQVGHNRRRLGPRAFPGRHRTFAPWGSGVRLEIDGDARDIRHGEISRFAGAATTRLVALDRPCHAVNLMASGGQPTLVVLARGARSPHAAIALLTAPTADTARFDVVRLDAGEPLPTEGIVVRDAGG